jgi:hypothetical protein
MLKRSSFSYTMQGMSHAWYLANWIMPCPAFTAWWVYDLFALI